MSDTTVDKGTGAEAGSPSTAAPATAIPWPAVGTQYYTLFVLGVVVLFTVLDRNILNLMIPAIKDDFGISDTQAALLMGAAFSLTYALAGLPIAMIADRWNRRNLIAICIAFWSLMTCACGIAQNYVHLFIARLGLGIGEAGYAPATWSIATDTFPREKVAFATGTIAIGAQLGTGLALVIGGVALALVANLPEVNLPGIGVLRPWQWAFVIVGFPGILWALVVLTMKEPARRGIDAAKKQNAASPIEVAKYMADDWRTYTAIIGGNCMKFLMALGTTAWMPTLFFREFGWDLTKIGLIQGCVIMVAGPLGLICGGKLSERWIKKGMQDANLRIVLYGLCLVVPLSIIFPLVPNPYLMLFLYGCNLFVAALGMGPGVAAFQVITPNRMRAQVSAVSLFSSNVVANVLGPLVVALFTDYLFSNEGDLKYSMSLCAAVLGPLALLTVWQGIKPYERSFIRTAKEFAE